MKTDIYQTVTTAIIDQLEAGTRPWVKPWNAGNTSRPLRANGEPYRGINVILLWMAGEAKGYAAPVWMTYRQAADLKAQVRKGEKASTVTYADKMTKDEGTDDERDIFFMKQYAVFNVEQIDGLPERFYATTTTHSLDPKERIEAAEAFFRAIPACVNHGGTKAFYSPSTHHVQMPPFTTFTDAGSYYGTLAHELTHWTRHPTCLNRIFGRGDGYAREELVAELGAAFLCADLGLELHPRTDHADYLASWLAVLKEDKKAIFTAASYAQKAADFLHGLVAQTADMGRIAA